MENMKYEIVLEKVKVTTYKNFQKECIILDSRFYFYLKKDVN